MQKRFAAGEIDRLELSFSKIEAIAANKNTLLAQYNLANAYNNLENTLQQPLDAKSRMDYESISLGSSSSLKPGANAR
jgi:outer membrane protein TolC